MMNGRAIGEFGGRVVHRFSGDRTYAPGDILTAEEVAGWPIASRSALGQYYVTWFQADDGSSPDDLGKIQRLEKEVAELRAMVQELTELVTEPAGYAPIDEPADDQATEVRPRRGRPPRAQAEQGSH